MGNSTVAMVLRPLSTYSNVAANLQVMVLTEYDLSKPTSHVDAHIQVMVLYRIRPLLTPHVDAHIQVMLL
jgi:hypothetical protein